MKRRGKGDKQAIGIRQQFRMRIIDSNDRLIEIEFAWDYMLESGKAFKTKNDFSNS